MGIVKALVYRDVQILCPTKRNLRRVQRELRYARKHIERQRKINEFFSKKN